MNHKQLICCELFHDLYQPTFICVDFVRHIGTFCGILNNILAGFWVCSWNAYNLQSEVCHVSYFFFLLAVSVCSSCGHGPMEWVVRCARLWTVRFPSVSDVWLPETKPYSVTYWDICVGVRITIVAVKSQFFSWRLIVAGIIVQLVKLVTRYSWDPEKRLSRRKHWFSIRKTVD